MYDQKFVFSLLVPLVTTSILCQQFAHVSGLYSPIAAVGVLQQELCVKLNPSISNMDIFTLCVCVQGEGLLNGDAGVTGGQLSSKYRTPPCPRRAPQIVFTTHVGAQQWLAHTRKKKKSLWVGSSVVCVDCID